MALLVGVLTVSSSRQTTELELSLRILTEELIPVLTDIEALSRSVMELSSEALNSLPEGAAEPEKKRILDHQESVVIAAEGMIAGTVASLNMLLSERFVEKWRFARGKTEELHRLAGSYIDANQAPRTIEEIEQLERAEDEAIQALEEIRLLAVKELHERHAEAELIQRQSVITQKTGLVIALILAVLLSIVLTSWFAIPLLRLADATKKIVRGDFNIQIPVDGNDELSSLGADFNAMAKSLQLTTVSKEKVDIILGSISEGLCVIDSQGNERECNPAWESMWKTGKHANTDLRRLKDFILSLPVLGDANGARGRRELVVGEEEKRHFSFSKIHIDSLPEVGDASLIVCQDITDSRMAEQEMARFREKMSHAEQLASLGSVAAILSHKLNQPLTVLRLLVQQMTRNIDDKEVIRRKLSESLQEIDVVRNQIREVLQYSRPMDTQQREVLELRATVGKTAELFARQFEEQAIEFRYDGISPEHRILANRDQIEEAIYILLENALHACSGKHSKISLSSETKDLRVVVACADTGQGIPKELQTRVFEPFFTTKPATRGTGLGLARLKQIITAHDGDIWVESEVGMGTTMYLSLPLNIQERVL